VGLIFDPLKHVFLTQFSSYSHVNTQYRYMYSSGYYSIKSNPCVSQCNYSIKSNPCVSQCNKVKPAC